MEIDMKLKDMLIESDSGIHTEKGFKFSTNWGSFAIGDKVKISDEGKENENYEDWLDTTFIINWVDLDDDGMGKKEPIMSFEDENGKDIPFSLYGYEIEKLTNLIENKDIKKQTEDLIETLDSYNEINNEVKIANAINLLIGLLTDTLQTK